jgi:hypothetical protein
MPAVKLEHRAVVRRVGPVGRLALAGVMSLAQLTSPDGVFMRDAKAKDLFTSARIAIFGGPGGIARLHAMRFTGHSRFPADDGTLIPATVEIRVLLPDRYLRIDTGSFGRRLTGYAGTTPLNLIEHANGQTTHDSGEPAAIVRAGRAQLARLVLGVATFTSPEMPMTFQTRGTPADMPGPSEPLGIDAVGEDGFKVRLVFDGKTHLPVRLVFWSFERAVLTATLADRRPTGGLLAPYSIITTNGDRIVDELVFDEVTVNPPLNKSDFSR